MFMWLEHSAPVKAPRSCREVVLEIRHIDHVTCQEEKGGSVIVAG